MGWQEAQSYELQEAPEASFAEAKPVYTGTETNWMAHDKPAGTYFYRVRMCDAGGKRGEWSDTQSTVVS
jgi:hypothetical protein